MTISCALVGVGLVVSSIVAYIFVFFAFSSKAFVFFAPIGTREERENATMFFNGTMFLELLLESVPQLVVTFVNEAALNQKMEWIFIAQVASSAIVMAMQLCPLVTNIANSVYAGDGFVAGLKEREISYWSQEDVEAAAGTGVEIGTGI